MNTPLRVALIASNRFPISQPFAGGLEAHVWHLARSLTALGHHVALFAATGSDSELGCDSLSVRDLTLSSAAAADPSASAPAFMADHHAYLTLMMHLATGSAEPFDLIHNHSLHHLPVAMAPLLSTPMLTTVHTPPTPWLESALHVTGGSGTHFAAVSRHTAKSWQHAVPTMSLVPNGVDSRLWPLGPGGDDLVWFGRITPEKAPHLAIDAAQRAGRSLVLAGPVHHDEYYRDQIAPRLSDRIRHVGHLRHDELAELVGRSAVALVTPVWDEPYGLVVAEAMSCGTPVVAFARGGIPEVVTDAGGRLVEPGDVDAMADAIASAEGLSRTAVHRHAVTRCSAGAMVAAYEAIYYHMIEEAGEGSRDRLLHPSLRPRTPQSGRQHHHPTASAGHRPDVTGRPGAASVRRHPDATPR
ncbi:glycosyltransferase family 4 protein [Mycolicibacterium sp. 050158]|uniref:glycosyltransferase family 4 protein n=1 Tax=Mycolicibacterium sp. 050158 TaxID=3090602 RepID=UPI00299D1B99|nr:glycosyltransferase family 4 protein [Mycolicibacterium sp. 050158]MDX1891174.1 glycosyltransferase family 4 protein [Mycolicibacterium sp. 050158]